MMNDLLKDKDKENEWKIITNNINNIYKENNSFNKLPANYDSSKLYSKTQESYTYTILLTITNSINSESRNCNIMDIKNIFINTFKPVVKNTIKYLMDSRDFLGYQLDLELGNLTLDEFEKLSEKYLINQENNYPEEILCREILLLREISGIDFEIEDYADFFNCSLQNVYKALTKNKAESDL